MDTPHRGLYQLAERNFIEKAERAEKPQWKWLLPYSTIATHAQYVDISAEDIGVDSPKGPRTLVPAQKVLQAPFADRSGFVGRCSW